MGQPYDPNQPGYQGQQGPPPGQQGGWQGQQQQGPPPGQQGWGQQQGPPAGQQGGWGQQQQGGYAPFQGGQPMGGGSPSGYNWDQMYGMADHSVGQLIEPGQYTAIVKSATWDRTKTGDKSAWTITFILTSGPRPGMKITMTLSVSPKKNNGEDNEAGMGIMFRQLAAMGIPVPPPYGQQGWWQIGWNEQQAGQAMVGHPVLLQLKHDEYDGVTRNKVQDILPPPPNAPTQLPQTAQQMQQAGPGPGPGQMQQGFQGGPGQGYQGQQGQAQGQAPQPWNNPQGGYQGQQQGPPPGQGYDPYTQQGQQGPPPGQGGYQGQQGGYQGQQQGPPANYQGPPQGYDPNVPPYAQQPNPGAPGTGQFTGQGQAWQPGVNAQQEQQAQQQMGQQQGPPNQQPWNNPNGAPGQPGQQGQAPQAPGWAGGQQ